MITETKLGLIGTSSYIFLVKRVLVLLIKVIEFQKWGKFYPTFADKFVWNSTIGSFLFCKSWSKRMFAPFLRQRKKGPTNFLTILGMLLNFRIIKLIHILMLYIQKVGKNSYGVWGSSCVMWLVGIFCYLWTVTSITYLKFIKAFRLWYVQTFTFVVICGLGHSGLMENFIE